MNDGTKLLRLADIESDASYLAANSIQVSSSPQAQESGTLETPLMDCISGGPVRHTASRRLVSVTTWAVLIHEGGHNFPVHTRCHRAL